MTWYAIKMAPSEYAIFDTLQDDDGRQAHLTGDVANALIARASEFFSETPAIAKADVIAIKCKEEFMPNKIPSPPKKAATFW